MRCDCIILPLHIADNMKLKVFLAQNNYRLKDFAEILDIDQNYLSRIMHGHVKPGKRLLADITRLTGGEIITFDDLITDKISPEKTEDAKADFRKPTTALQQMSIYDLNKLIDSQE